MFPLGIGGATMSAALVAGVRPWPKVLVGVAAIAAASLGATPAFAAPIWNVESEARPTAFQPSDGTGNDEYRIELENLGSESGGQITVVDHLPPGVGTTGTPVEEDNFPHSRWICSEGAGQTIVICTSNVSVAPAGDTRNNANPTETASFVDSIMIPVTVAGGTPAETATNMVTVSGGGAPSSASSSNPNPINSGLSTAFGVSYLNFRAIGPNGEPASQAGGHPWAVTTDAEFNQELAPGVTNAAFANEEGDYINASSSEEVKTGVFEVPLGLLGNPMATPRCTQRQFTEAPSTGPYGNNSNGCPADTRVGVLYLEGPGFGGPYQLFNLVSASGHAAEFGFTFVGVGIILYGDAVHSDRGGYVVRFVSSVPQVFLHAFSLTFFGDPATAFETGEKETRPFLANPVDCAASEAARTFEMHFDTWTAPGIGDPFNADFSDPNWVPAGVTMAPVEGCKALRFDPSLSFQPAAGSEGGSTQVDEPSGYDVNLEVPQTETFSELQTPELKTATVTLPAGLSVSPSAANGLQACTDAQIALESDEPGSCPLASQVGTVQIVSPLLERPLDGAVFLGEPECGAGGVCTAADAEAGHIFRLFLQTHSDEVGTTIKLAGAVRANASTGQLIAEFKENPQLPFSDLELNLKSGARAPLANPQSCGTFTTSSVLEPWSAPVTANTISESPFAISWDGHGGACPASMPFAPAFNAGTESPAAGAYSPLTVEFSRQDREQDLSGITVHTPAGVLGNLSGVPLCGEPQANAGTCGEASLIGTTSAVVGTGEDPFAITDGRVYLTGPTLLEGPTPLEGPNHSVTPFGLSIVVPANAGPFHLGNVIVRASIAISPQTAALTVTSDPLPQIVDGVPIRLGKVVVDVNRPGFMLNATNCAAQHVEATISGLEGFTATHGSSVAVSSPYSPSGCANLQFKPRFSVATSGKTSKADGASLTATVSEPANRSSGIGQLGTQANLTKVKVDLPKQLPSRLTTLQKACTSAQFQSNPAGCPPASFIGHAVVRTPILPGVGGGLLTGPAIFVSHGGEAFPSLTLVLQGDDVTIDLVGTTNISKAGITSTTFKTVPDAPFSTFELTLPEGPFSALAANGSLCAVTKTVLVKKKVTVKVKGRKKTETRKVKTTEAASLAMPTEFVAQNGAVIHQSTPIRVIGCPPRRAKQATKKTKTKKKARKTTTRKSSHGKGRK
jgi:hypothetical protein